MRHFAELLHIQVANTGSTQALLLLSGFAVGRKFTSNFSFQLRSLYCFRDVY